MGAIFSVVVASYPGQEQRATGLLTYPTLFMGIGNLISMPVALAVGRRPVFLGSLLLLTVSGIWCASSKSLTSHLAGRAFMSLAAGQSEALCPMMVAVSLPSTLVLLRYSTN
jgi:predicted MFS family arabinose efflux permease